MLLASLSDNICETIKEASSEKTRLELFFAVVAVAGWEDDGFLRETVDDQT